MALGALLAVFGWYLRRKQRESEIFVADAAHRVRRSTLEVLRRHSRAALRVAGFTLGTTVVYYTFAVYLPNFAQRTHHIPPMAALWASVAAQVVFIGALPLWGKLSDRIGRKPLLLTFGIGFSVLSPMFFASLSSSPWSLFLVLSAAPRLT